MISSARLAIEGLEDRLALSTFYVEPLSFPVDGSHFHTVQDALGIAGTGDLVQIEPGVNVASVGSTVGAPAGAATLTSVSAIAATSITVNSFIGAGEVIQIGSGASQETDLIRSTAVASSGQFTLNLAQPLTSAHIVGDRVDTVGQLGVATGITLQGDTVGAGIAVNSPLAVWTGATGVTFNALTFRSPVTLLAGSSDTTFSSSVLGVVTENASPAGNGGHNVFQHSTFTGALSLTGNPSGTATTDQIVNNQFQGGTLTLASDDSALVQGNIFNDVGNVTAIGVTSSQNVVIAANSITIVNGGGALTGPSAVKIGSTTSATLSVSLVNNYLNTGGTGQGVFIVTPPALGGNIRVFLQGNDFHFNLFGIADQGDGTAGTNSAGIVDAGAGALGSLGGNNFRQFRPSDATAGNRFAIYLFNTQAANGTINAQDNLFSTTTPAQVVKDFADNTLAGATLSAGTGTIVVGNATAQLSADQQFVQSLYNDFLGRSGSQSELNGWVALLPSVGQTGVANSIIHSAEALTRLVDSYYQNYLGRTADPGGEQGWVNAIVNGMTAEQVTAAFLASPEYLNHLSSPANSPDTAFVQSLYNVLLGRVGSNVEVSGWVEHLNSGMSRQAVALAITQSAEYRTVLVQQLYFNELHRQSVPSATEVSGWVNSGVDLLNMEADFAGTPELYLNG
ncbi:MAG TPA: DUF4214 domain-containing protein [Gemmataceae bacterium]|nr:DUF4214 domain-containing protein [Gemmataceae bacterium]